MSRVFRVRLLAGLLVGGVLPTPGCSSDSSRSPMLSSGGRVGARGGTANASGGRATGGNAPRAGTGGASPGGDRGDAGQAGDAGARATGGSGGRATGGSDAGGQGAEGGVPPDPYACPSDTSGDPAPALSSQCDPSATWGKGALVPVEMGSADQLLAITPDELTMLWFDSRGSVGTYRLADRAASDAEFEPSQALDFRDVIALSPDGLRAATLSFDQSAIVEYVRAARGEAFGMGADGTFSELNADAQAKGYRVLDALIAPDDKTLYYNVFSGEDSVYPLHVSSRTGGEPWPLGQPIEACEFKAAGPLVRHPTGVSEDGLTLFFYDPIRELARAAFRSTPAGPFVWFSDLGPLLQAMPNRACDRLYYWASGAESSIFVAPAE